MYHPRLFSFWSFAVLIAHSYTFVIGHDTTDDVFIIPNECNAHHLSTQLMNENDAYRTQWEQQNIITDQFIAQMKSSKDHSYLKILDSSSTTQDTTTNEDNNKDHRNLFSIYDDEIDSTPVISIPIIYHVLYSNENENLSDNQLESQTKSLNRDMRANNSEILNGKVPNIWSNRVGDSKLEFYTNRTIRVPIDNANITCNNDTLIKLSEFGGSDVIDPETYLNIWVCNITTNILGYAYYPCLLGTQYEWVDGVVLTTQIVGSIEDDDGTFKLFPSTHYVYGRTGSHEVGHYLNLVHIWGEEDGCIGNETSDFISDTPRQNGSSSYCPDNTTNTCYNIDPETGIDLRDMYENIMDYTYHDCKFIFTEEQVWRMRSVLSPDGCRSTMYYNGIQSLSPTNNPTNNPTNVPSNIPSDIPTDNPSKIPTTSGPQTYRPSERPTDKPTTTTTTTNNPTEIPTGHPETVLPSLTPSNTPSDVTLSPSIVPSIFPSIIPSLQPTGQPVNTSIIIINAPTQSPSYNLSTIDTCCYARENQERYGSECGQYTKISDCISVTTQIRCKWKLNQVNDECSVSMNTNENDDTADDDDDDDDEEDVKNDDACCILDTALIKSTFYDRSRQAQYYCNLIKNKDGCSNMQNQCKWNC